MTSNHPELLDPAMIRPGRVDSLITLGHITKSQLNDMFLSYFPDQATGFELFYKDFIEKMGEDNISTARMQRFFFSHLGCSDIREFMNEWTPEPTVENEEKKENKDNNNMESTNQTAVAVLPEDEWWEG